jgi:hypothetical protein
MENIFFNQQNLGCLAYILLILVSGMFEVEMEWGIVACIKEW